MTLHAASREALGLAEERLGEVLADAGADAAARFFRFEISGSGFLRHMVRTIAGTLADIGRGNMAVDDMRAIIESKDRSRTGQTAPAQGLMLWKVHY